MFCVYKHTAPNGKVYIGITGRNPLARWNGGNGYRNNPHFWNAICKYGWDNIRHEIIMSGLSKEESEQCEIMLISRMIAPTLQKAITSPPEAGVVPGIRGNSQKISAEINLQHKKSYTHRAVEMCSKIKAEAIMHFMENTIQPTRGRRFQTHNITRCCSIAKMERLYPNTQILIRHKYRQVCIMCSKCASG